MPRTTQLLACLIAPLATASASASTQVEQVHFSDANAPIPGAMTVTTDAISALPGGAGGGAPQLPGWPKTIGGNGTFAPTRGLVFADLDRDGGKDVIVSSTDARLYAWNAAGTDLPGFPVILNSYAQYAPSVADLDADGDLEIVQFTRGLTSGGRFYIIDHNGQVLPGFPLSVGNNNLEGSPTLYDLDDDGDLEIVVPERAYPNTLLHVYDHSGTEWGGNWPVTLDHVPTCSTAIDDVDGDGEPELVYMSYDSIYVLERDGSILPGWPQGIPNAQFSYQSPALVDLDGDGDLEIVVGAHQSAAGVYVYQHDGTLYPGWPRLVGTWTYCPPTVVDLEGDGVFEIISGRNGFGPNVTSSVFYVWNEDGVTRPGFPYVSPLGGGSGGPITVADLDGDGVQEIFSDHNIQSAGQGFVFGVDASGNDLPGFPLRPVGFTYQNGPMIEDVNGDGTFELGVLSYSGALVDVNLYDLPDLHQPAQVAWSTYHKQNARGGRAAGGDRLHLAGSATLGGTLTLTVVGDNPGRVSLWLGTQIAHAPSPYGWVHLAQPFRRTYFQSAPTPASGQRVATQPIPNFPALIGLEIFFQGRTTRFGGGEVTNLVGVEIR